MVKSFILKVLRGFPKKQYFEEFELEVKRFYNITAALMDIQKAPVNVKGKRVSPIVWEQGCLEEVCGACSMLINGKPRQACTALVEQILEQSGGKKITLAPFTKFPLIRDLVVDRSRMFKNLMKVHAWHDVDDTQDRGFGPKIAQSKQEAMYALSTCITCGNCSEACPQVNSCSEFIGPAPISQVRLFNAHPLGKMQKQERLRPLMQKGGVAECGNAQNCRRICPKNIPLTESIALMGREVTKQAIRDSLSLPDVDD